MTWHHMTYGHMTVEEMIPKTKEKSNREQYIHGAASMVDHLPPCVVWDRIPNILFVAFKKCLAWSKAWKPTTSAHVIDCEREREWEWGRERERNKERIKEREKVREPDRWTDGQTDRQTGRQTDRRTDRHNEYSSTQSVTHATWSKSLAVGNARNIYKEKNRRESEGTERKSWREDRRREGEDEMKILEERKEGKKR